MRTCPCCSTRKVTCPDRTGTRVARVKIATRHAYEPVNEASRLWPCAATPRASRRGNQRCAEEERR